MRNLFLRGPLARTLRHADRPFVRPVPRRLAAASPRCRVRVRLGAPRHRAGAPPRGGWHELRRPAAGAGRSRSPAEPTRSTFRHGPARHCTRASSFRAGIGPLASATSGVDTDEQRPSDRQSRCDRQTCSATDASASTQVRRATRSSAEPSAQPRTRNSPHRRHRPSNFETQRPPAAEWAATARMADARHHSAPPRPQQGGSLAARSSAAGRQRSERAVSFRTLASWARASLGDSDPAASRTSAGTHSGKAVVSRR